MRVNMIFPFTTLSWLLSLFCSLYAAYFALITLFALKKRKHLPSAQRDNRFLVIIAARNEAKVIGQLIDSLKQQNYPPDKYQILVAPNNCTDNTRETALAHGAQIYDCQKPIRSKGDVLAEVFETCLPDASFDGYCIFDADNLVHPEFLNSMNRALENGHTIAQGYRDSKNPVDTAISSDYSIYYWMVNRFFNLPRYNIGLSAIVSGSGFMISRKLLNQMGGWHTRTITEDLEISTLSVLNNHKVAYIPEAIIYDEQPLTFKQSWHQRLRWSTGIWQNITLYFPRLIRKLFKEHDWKAADQMLFYLAPVMQIVYTFSFILELILQFLYIEHHLFPAHPIYRFFFLSIDISYILTTLLAGFTVVIEQKKNWGLLKGVLTYWIFISSWIAINLISLFKRTKNWTSIEHTRAIDLKQLK